MNIRTLKTNAGNNKEQEYRETYTRSRNSKDTRQDTIEGGIYAAVVN